MFKRFRPYSLKEGKSLIKLARKAVENYIKTGKVIEIPKDTPSSLLKDKYGVFTTIERIVSRNKYELRGCIGYPRGYQNVAKATILSAISAATQDPRFPPMDLSELNGVIFEVSILSELELIVPGRPKNYPKYIRIGYHGLVIEKRGVSGLLLPQVPVEYKWNEETFLSQACMKAWLPPDAWLDKDTKVYRFEAQIFREKEPNEEIYERDLLKELENY